MTDCSVPSRHHPFKLAGGLAMAPPGPRPWPPSHRARLRSAPRSHSPPRFSTMGPAPPTLLLLLFLLLLLCAAAPAFSLVINTTTKGCSRECESRHCQDPFRLKYGKYCGIGYTGCGGEAPCDGIDSCCMNHDQCIGTDLGNYGNRTCNDQLKHCVEQFQDANSTQFNGSSCSAKDLEDVIIASMNIATLGSSPDSLFQLANSQWVPALVSSLSAVSLFGNWW